MYPTATRSDPKDLYKRYFGYTEEQRTRANSLLMRNYLTNFDRPLLLTYIEGDYQVEKVRKLGPEDFLDPGIRDPGPGTGETRRLHQADALSGFHRVSVPHRRSPMLPTRSRRATSWA